MNKQPFTLDRTVRTVGGILLLAGLLLLTQRLSGVLLPFVAAWLIAYMLNPFVHFFQKHLKIKKRGLAVLLLFLIIIGLVTSIVVFATSNITNEISEMKKLISNYIALEHSSNLPPLLQEFLSETG